MKRVSLKRALKFIGDTKGQIFAVEFEKRTAPGEIRYMRCRTGVKKYLVEKPSKAGVNFEANYSLCVCDMDLVNDNGEPPYRTIPVEGIRRIMMSGEWYRVVQSSDRLDLTKLVATKRRKLAYA
jgi:hypothetical protein